MARRARPSPSNPLLSLQPLATGGRGAAAAPAAHGRLLIAGVWDNVVSAERMAEFEAFQRRFGIPLPQIGAPLSVYAQLLCGAAFIAGFLTRWAGLIMAFNFAVPGPTSTGCSRFGSSSPAWR
jgi:hypothetical protein